MPHIVVYNLLPSEIRDKLQLGSIERAITKEIISVKELKLKTEDISYTFPEDPSVTPDECPIVVIVDLLFEKPERTWEVRNFLAQSIAGALLYEIKKIRGRLPSGMRVAVKRFDPAKDGFCST